MQSYNMPELDTILLLKSIGINFPLLREWDAELTKPLLVVVNDGQMKAVADLLSRREVPRLNDMMNRKQVVRVLAEANSTFVIYPYTQTAKGNEMLKILASIVKVGVVADIKIGALPIVVSERLPVGIDIQDYFTVFLEGCLQNVHVDDLEVVPEDEQLTVVYDKIHSLLLKEHSPEERAFVAASCFLYPNMVACGAESEFCSLVEQARNLVKLNDDNSDANDITDVFIAELYRWQEKTGFCDICALPNLEMSVIDKLECVMLYDEKFVYMKEALFKEITQPLLVIFSEPILKASLVKEGILCTENARTFTVKVGFYNVGGVYRRERMLRFDRNRLCKVGEIGFVEICSE